MRQSTYDNKILSEAIITAKKLRALSLENAKYSLKEALSRKTLPLQRIVDLNHLPDIEFIDAIFEQKRAEEDEELNQQGLPYLNNKHRKRKRNTDDELDERGRIGIHRELTDDDVIEIDDEFEDDEDDGDDVDNDQSDFADDVLDERIRKNQSHLSRTQFNSSPAFITSGVGSVKLTDRERQILTKNLKLNELKRSSHPKINKQSDDRDLLKKRSGIKENTGKAKQLIFDLNNKNKILIG